MKYDFAVDVLLAASLLVSAAPSKAALPHPEVLNQLLGRVEESAATGAKPLVIFDIDDTLTSTEERSRKILGEFIAQPEVQAAFPEETAKVRPLVDVSGLPPEQRPRLRFDLKDTARDAGVANESFLDQLSRFWAENPRLQSGRFFDNRYLLADEPNPGAVEFVQAVVAAGGTAAYMTGRKQALMEGTLAVLEKHGFPLPQAFPLPEGQNGGAVIFLKQDISQADDAFKAEKIKELKREHPEVTIVGGFDNEPRNINAFRREGPPASLMVFLDTKHSNAPDIVDSAIPWVKNFLRRFVP